MYLDSSGRLLLGTTTEGQASADNFTVADSGHCGITIRSGTTSEGAIYFSDGTSGDAEYRGQVFYDHDGDYMRFSTAASEQMRIDSSGRLLLGTTTEGESSADNLTIADSGDCGITIRTGTSSSGRLFFSDGTSGNDEYMGFVQYGHSNNAMLFGTNGTERMRIDSSGRLLINHTADTSPVGYESKLQLCDTSYQGSSFSIRRDGGASGPTLIFAKSRGTTKGANTVVQDGDNVGTLRFFAADGTDCNSEVAQIRAQIDDTPGSNDTPGRLVFKTTFNGSADVSERMRITNGGYLKASEAANYYNAGAYYHEFNQARAAQNMIFRSTHASYGATQVQFGVSRAATSAYWFVQGVSSYDGSADTEFYIRGDGNAFADGTWSGGGADYSEYFEWSDGNTLAEDRRGISVVLVDDKIREAVAGEEPIGVISGNPSVVGDADVDRWKGKYLRDDYGSYVLDEDGYRQLNPDYDSDVEYVQREDRAEWDTVGLMGKLRIRKGQVTGTRWIKMRDVSNTVEEWLVR